MVKHNGYIGDTENKKSTLIARIDQRVIPALDRIASANEVNTSHLMGTFFSDVADAVDLLATESGESADDIEDRFARLIVRRCPGVDAETLSAIERIWKRAAEIKAQEGG